MFDQAFQQSFLLNFYFIIFRLITIFFDLMVDEDVIKVPGLNPVIIKCVVGCHVEKSAHWVKVNPVNIGTPDSDHSVSFHYS